MTINRLLFTKKKPGIVELSAAFIIILSAAVFASVFAVALFLAGAAQ
jgi:hypothetical protein